MMAHARILHRPVGTTAVGLFMLLTTTTDRAVADARAALSNPPVNIRRVIRTIDWSRADASTLPAGAKIVADGGPYAGGYIEIEAATVAGATSKPAKAAADRLHRATLLHIDNPGIESSNYALIGRVSYADVKGDSFLEMYNTFADNESYFSRTLSDTGPLGRITGNSDWRWFVLPFQSSPGEVPQELKVNAVFADNSGIVRLGPMQLVELSDPPFGAGGHRMGGIVGGVLGGALGLIGATIGVLGSTGKARNVTLGLLRFMAVAGIVLLVIAGLLLAADRPFMVAYPFGLSGLIAAVLGFSMYPQIRRRYEALELHRMSAIDARG